VQVVEASRRGCGSDGSKDQGVVVLACGVGGRRRICVVAVTWREHRIRMKVEDKHCEILEK
jgi:hypothetical protein